MPTQSYATHRQFVPLFHGVLGLLLLLTLIGSVVNLCKSLGDHERLYSAALLVALSVAAILLFWYCRSFAMTVQDRAIRAEENLRHFGMTGKRLDTRLTVKQIVALRFAGDGEFVALAQKAAQESMAPDAIKREVKNWRPDTDRA